MEVRGCGASSLNGLHEPRECRGVSYVPPKCERREGRRRGARISLQDVAAKSEPKLARKVVAGRPPRAHSLPSRLWRSDMPWRNTAQPATAELQMSAFHASRLGVRCLRRQGQRWSLQGCSTRVWAGVELSPGGRRVTRCGGRSIGGGIGDSCLIFLASSLRANVCEHGRGGGQLGFREPRVVTLAPRPSIGGKLSSLCLHPSLERGLSGGALIGPRSSHRPTANPWREDAQGQRPPGRLHLEPPCSTEFLNDVRCTHPAASLEAWVEQARKRRRIHAQTGCR